MKLHTIDRDEFHRTYGRLDTRRAIYGFTLQDDTNVILTLLAYQKPERILEIGTAAGHKQHPGEEPGGTPDAA